ncbi:MAG TPA: glycosyltransferase family 9 protein [Vicinamibacterales bacterium]|nr:glycosyltransferase family 9 protein [Vicinamibacterales bacterium]
MNILVVRLGALGDVVHAIPAVAALRRAFPSARIDWLVEARHRPMVDLVTAIDSSVVVSRPTLAGWSQAVAALRAVRYDTALDLQGLLKSALLARASGASRVVGFSIWHLREKSARPFYSDAQPVEGGHVISKNLRLLRAVGVETQTIEFPIAPVDSDALERLRERLGGRGFVLINPGAAWPNKRWLPERFGALAAFLRDVRGLVPVVLWGPGEETLADRIVAESSGAAMPAPPTTIPDIVALARAAALVVSGDTGPLHIATAVGTPTVSLFGPTDPVRNGPYASDDVVVSRFDRCGCRYDRRCHQAAWCLAGVEDAEVAAAVQQRLLPGSARARE